MKHLISTLTALLITSFCMAQSEVFFTQNDLVLMKNGERYIGHFDHEAKTQFKFTNGQSIKLDPFEIKKIYHGGKDIVIRPDGKFYFKDYLGLTLSNEQSSMYTANLLNLHFTFNDKYRLGLLFGASFENDFDFFFTEVTVAGIQLRHYKNLGKRRFFAQAQFLHYLEDNEDNFRNAEINSYFAGSGGVGMYFLNRKRVKFDASIGMAGRRIKQTAESTSGTGTPIILSQNEFAYSPYLQLNVMFRLAGL